MAWLGWKQRGKRAWPRSSERAAVHDKAAVGGMRQLAADVRELLKLHHFGGKLQLLCLLAAETATQTPPVAMVGGSVWTTHIHSRERARMRMWV